MVRKLYKDGAEFDLHVESWDVAKLTRKKSRVMLVAVALGSSDEIMRLSWTAVFTYKLPVRNTTNTPTFLFQCNFSVLNSGSGITIMTTSKAVLIVAVVTVNVFTSMHLFGSAGFQIDWIGIHWNIAKNVVMAADVATQTIVVQAMKRSQGAMNMRR